MKDKKKQETKNVDVPTYVKIGLLGLLVLATLTTMIFTIKYLPEIAKNTKGITANTNTDDTTDTEEPTTGEYDVSKYKAIDLAGLKNVIKSKSMQVVYIGRATCGYCVQFLPIMTQAQADYDFTTNYFDITQVINFTTGAVSDQTGFDYITGLNAFFKDNFGSTPMVALFKNGKYVDGTVGYTDLATYSKFLEKNGFKK